MNKILLVEDDCDIAQHLTEFLSGEGYEVAHSVGQSDAVRRFNKEKFDCVLLDISLADGSGFAVCREIRAASDVPIIFLTAAADEGCTVAGLEMGADDYISKPFRPRELAARIKNVIKRKGGGVSALSCGDVCIDAARGIVTKNGNELFLSALEYRLLLTFFSNSGKLLTRDRLAEELWASSGAFVTDNTLNVYIKRLREKIENDPKDPKIIKTVRGLGYKVGD